LPINPTKKSGILRDVITHDPLAGARYPPRYPFIERETKFLDLCSTYGKDERELLLILINQPNTTGLDCEQPDDGFKNYFE
jgi:hypothetical protein